MCLVGISCSWLYAKIRVDPPVAVSTAICTAFCIISVLFTRNLEKSDFQSFCSALSLFVSLSFFSLTFLCSTLFSFSLNLADLLPFSFRKNLTFFNPLSRVGGVEKRKVSDIFTCTPSSDSSGLTNLEYIGCAPPKDTDNEMSFKFLIPSLFSASLLRSPTRLIFNSRQPSRRYMTLGNAATFDGNCLGINHGPTPRFRANMILSSVLKIGSIIGSMLTPTKAFPTATGAPA
mmetsp:Transcript_34515/g.41290  ORF Transcript_34515/g.41290 Transcript_34515/m.41290 type:complete len:232 (-) Transcript_34515:828-1523(-)